MSNLELQIAVREVLKLSAVDPDFRQLAVIDGRAAMSRVGNFQPPDRLNVNFVDNYRKSTITVALPDAVREIDLLNEEDLERSATSDCSISCVFTCLGSIFPD